MKIKTLALIFLSLAMSVSSWGYSFVYNGIYYKILSGNTSVEVTYGNSTSNSYSGSVTIPSSVSYSGRTYSVTSIGDTAFYWCTGLTSVTIPNSVTSIGGHAFYSCRDLTSVTIPNSVTSIGDEAFLFCTGITAPLYNNTIFAYMPSSYSGSYTIPSGITTIAGGAFSGCKGLTNITIPNSVTSIGGDAFHNCTGLTSVTLPNSVTSIGDQAFRGCTGLTSVTLPNSVTSIGNYAFQGCTRLTSVTLPNSLMSISNYAFSGCVSLTSVTIPNGVTSIDYCAFYGCTGLTSVTIPNSVTSIGSSAFYGCTRLTSVTLPNSVTSIGAGAFERCTGLKNVYFKRTTPPTIGSDCFYNCNSLLIYHVPCWTTNAYQTRLGVSSNKIAQYFAYSISVSSSDPSLGFAEITRQPSSCEQQTAFIKATAILHHHFVRWSDGNTSNPRSVNMTSDTLLTAFFEIDRHTISGTGTNGSVSGGGLCDYGSTVTLTATANAHYHFKQWSDGNTSNPRNFAVTGDTTYTAVFEGDLQTITASGTNGIVSGSGSYNYGSTATLTAIGNAHYHFKQWSDGNTSNPRSVNVSGDTTYTAIFEIDKHTISVSGTNGSVSGGGLYDYGSTVILTATANAHYHFVQWSDGSTSNPKIVSVTGDTTYIAVFEGDLQTITVDGTNGTVSGGGSYNYGSTATLTATGNAHYHFKQWSDGNVTNPRSVNVSGDTTYTAIFEIDKHTISVSGTNGSVSGGGLYDYGSTVILTATANAHYHFVQWSDGSTSNPKIVSVTGDTTYIAVFEGDLQIITADGTNGTVSGSGAYNYGSTATLTAIGNAHYHFKQWSDGNATNPRTVNVAGDASYTAVFEIDKHTISGLGTNGTVSGGGLYDYGSTATLTAVGDAHYHFVQWSDGSTSNPKIVSVTGDTTYIAVFEGDLQIITADGINGTVLGGGSYNYGSTATLTATANTHYHFKQWYDGNTSNPRTVNVTGDATYTAIFEGDLQTVTASGTNGTVSGGGLYNYGSTAILTAAGNAHYHFVNWSDGDTVNPRSVMVTGNATYTAIFEIDSHIINVIGENGTVTGSGTYNYGTSVPLTATANEHYHFVGWSDGNTSSARTIIVNGDTTYSAIFEIDKHVISGSGTNGTVSGGGLYDYGSVATLTAAGNAHYHFVQWSDGSTSNPKIVSVTGDTTYTAVFEIDRHIVNVVGENGTVTGSGTYNYGTSVPLTATANEHYHFVSWSDGNTSSTRTIIVEGDTTYTATFELDKYVISGSGTNGTVSGGGLYDYGSVATLTAAGNAHYHFVQWSDGSTSNPKIVSVTGDTTYTAVFEIDRHIVNVVGENGTVTGSGTYNYGTSVPLTATADEHYHFVGWSDGNTSSTRTIIVEGDTTYTATFELDKYVISGSGTNGTVSGGGLYDYGSVATLTAAGNAHYHFVQWSDGSTSNPKIVSVTGDTTYTAVFEIDSHIVNVIGENGTVTGSGTYNYGTSVPLTATANEHYHFVSWSDGNTSSARTIIVNGDTTYTATFELDKYIISGTGTNGLVSGGGSYDYGSTATLTAAGNAHYHFVQWSDGNTSNPRTVNVTVNATYTAIFEMDSHIVNVIGENGTVTGSGTYNYGTSVPLTATANEHYHFVSWSDGNTSSTRTIIVEGDTTYTAIFEIDKHIISGTGTNGLVSGGGSYDYGSTATLMAAGNAHYHFVQWSDGNTSNPRTVNVTGNATYTAVFEIDKHTISASGTNGSVSGGGSYDYGSTATLTATADEHYHFVSWSDGNTSNPRTVNVTGNATYTAVFEIDKHNVTATATNGTIAGLGEYDYGATVSLTAIPDDYYCHVNWSDGDTSLVKSFVITGDMNFTADFTKCQYVITATCEHGTVTGSGTYENPDVVTLIATPDEGYRFVKWSDENDYNPRIFVVRDDLTVEAICEEAPVIDDVEDVQADAPAFYVVGTTVFNPSNEPLRVYSAAGKLLKSADTDIDLFGYPAGIYMIVDGRGNAIKVPVR